MKLGIALSVFVALGASAACGIGEVSYEGKACPCPSGYRCDHETNRCTTRASEKGGTSGDGGGGASGAGNGGTSAGGTSTGGTSTGGTSAGESGGGGEGGSGNASGKGGTGAGGVGTGGTAGLGGTAGTTNPWNCVPASACETLPNHGLDIVAVELNGDHWTDCSKNCLGIYVLIVGHTSDEAEVSVDVSTGDICLSGFARANGMVELDVALGDFDIADPAHPERAISGFEFTVEGADVPAAFQVGYYMAEDPLYPRCVELTSPAGHHSVPFDSVRIVCGTAVDAGTLDFRHVMNLSVYIPSYGGNVTFDFCLTGLAAVR